jgi:hypothetical protein
MSKFILPVAEIAAGVVLQATGVPIIPELLINAGSSQLLGSLGTIGQGTQDRGAITTKRNPVATWQYPYGRVRSGGKLRCR